MGRKMSERLKQVTTSEDRLQLFSKNKQTNKQKLCFVINVLNNKTIILFNFAEYPLILVDSA